MLEHIKYLIPKKLKLTQIYLDPNNPRFVEEVDDVVDPENYFDESVQEKSSNLLEKKYGLKNLQDSIISNGYLPIDRIVVRKIDEYDGEDRYLVLEGNRRVAAAKKVSISSQSNEIELEDYVLESLNDLPVLEYTGSDPNAAWIFQGLRHISGIKDWSAVHKAKLLVEQINENNLSYTEVGRIFGISHYSAAQWARAYFTYIQIVNIDDFKNDIDYRCFPYLQELFGRSDIALKNWLNWDDNDKEFANEENLAEYLSWLYPKIDEEGNFDPERAGEWNKRRIPTAQDQRIVSSAISDHKDLFNSFRQGHSINIIRLKLAQEEESKKQTVSAYIEQFTELIEEFNDIPVLKLKNENRDKELADKISELIKTLEGLNKFFDEE
ncbi:MAG: hypothetical protein C0592_10810 [Marinilabiliales bacterium]|nr:MAG: hypothetical protein C0592_10810 [Marinilabiliales bacterium]